MTKSLILRKQKILGLNFKKTMVNNIGYNQLFFKCINENENINRRSVLNPALGRQAKSLDKKSPTAHSREPINTNKKKRYHNLSRQFGI